MDNQNSLQEETVKDNSINQNLTNSQEISLDSIVSNEENPVVDLEKQTGNSYENKNEVSSLESSPNSIENSQPVEVPEKTEQYQNILNEYAANTEKKPIIENNNKSTEEQLQDLGIETPPKTGGGFLKVIFIISLIIFIFILSTLLFVYFKSKNNSNYLNNVTEINSTPVSTETCSLNDKIYKVGESFLSADGCNTCTCVAIDEIVCLEESCELDVETIITPTESTTTSSDLLD